MFAFFHIAEQKVLYILTVDIRKRPLCKGWGDVVFKKPLVFFKSERLCRFLFESQPVFCKVVEENGVPAFCFYAAGCGIVVERVNEFLF